MKLISAPIDQTDEKFVKSVLDQRLHDLALWAGVARVRAQKPAKYGDLDPIIEVWDSTWMKAEIWYVEVKLLQPVFEPLFIRYWGSYFREIESYEYRAVFLHLNISLMAT